MSDHYTRLNHLAHAVDIADRLSFNQTRKHLSRLNIRLASYKELYDQGQLAQENSIQSVWIRNDLENAIEKFEVEKKDSAVKRRFEMTSVIGRLKSVISSGLFAALSAGVAFYLEIGQPVRDVLICSALSVFVLRVATAIRDAWTESYERCVRDLDDRLKALAADVKDIKIY